MPEDVSEGLRGTAPTASLGIAKLATLSRFAFQNSYLGPRVPVALQAPAIAMPAVNAWDLDFFAGRYGDRRVPIDGLRSGVHQSLADYVARIRSPDSTSEERAPYMRNLMLFESFPELRADFEMPWFADPNWLQSKVLGDFSGGSWRYWVELFLSGAGTRFPFVHTDPYCTHAWSLQLSGSKRFWLWPPVESQLERLCDGSLPRENPKLITRDTRLEDFVQGVLARSILLHPGEMLCLPAGWWHTTETHEESVTLGGNFVEASNWKDFERLYRARNHAHSLRQIVNRRLVSTAAPVFFRCAQSLQRLRRRPA